MDVKVGGEGGAEGLVWVVLPFAVDISTSVCCQHWNNLPKVQDKSQAYFTAAPFFVWLGIFPLSESSRT